LEFSVYQLMQNCHSLRTIFSGLLFNCNQSLNLIIWLLFSDSRCNLTINSRINYELVHLDQAMLDLLA
jgi:hypothetical protein